MRPVYTVNNKIFITGGTGYIGTRLIDALSEKNYEVIALCREESKSKLKNNCNIIIGNALDNKTYKDNISPCDTLIHLVGVTNPSPNKRKQFEEIDLVSAQQSLDAALYAKVKHFIYMSVASPAPIMRDYIEIRLKCESIIMHSGINATFLKPWYVLGPGHYWPIILLPYYKILQKFPPTRDFAMRLSIVKISSLIQALLFAVRNPANGIRVIRAPQISKF